MRYFSCCHNPRVRRRDDYNSEINHFDAHYSSGESDSEYTHMFAYLPTDQKMKRMLHMWARVYTKLNAANLLIFKYKDLRTKTRVQGRYNALKYRRDFNEEEE